MNRSILVVDDDADARQIYSDALSARGFRVLTAIHGAEGVHMARKHRPDLIVMDIRMPIMDGWHAMSYLRSDAETARIPIWGLSAHFSDEGSPHPGFSRMFNKPMPPVELADLVEAYLGRERSAHL